MLKLAHKAWRWALLLPPREDVQIPPIDPGLTAAHMALRQELETVRLMKTPPPPTLRNVAP